LVQDAIAYENLLRDQGASGTQENRPSFDQDSPLFSTSISAQVYREKFAEERPGSTAPPFCLKKLAIFSR
jgi:hypothetical protein